MALIAVLWIVAALGIIVAGLVQSIRSEIRLVSGARDAVVPKRWEMLLFISYCRKWPATAKKSNGW